MMRGCWSRWGRGSCEGYSLSFGHVHDLNGSVSRMVDGGWQGGTAGRMRQFPDKETAMREIEAELCRAMGSGLEDWTAYCEAKAAQEPKAEARIDFRLEMRSPRGDVERVLASTSSIPIGEAVFAEARRLYADARLTLRHGGRVIKEYPERGI